VQSAVWLGDYPKVIVSPSPTTRIVSGSKIRGAPAPAASSPPFRSFIAGPSANLSSFEC